ncbi:MAG: Phosphatidylserine decarboxylase proenzyme [Bryobacteraceae bacterium]|nr:Phosphatidylserine decarboxylase proenzyme [Bryobacteraceae bacterium]MCC6344605.1 phosphatidylserine decarboxylase family protein [Bryobacterales bacterium]
MVVDGIYYALGLTAGGLLVSYLSRPVYGLPLFILALFCLYFFRDPDRVTPEGPYAVSPADGKVVAIRKENGGTRISIFLNVFDVHVNRSPIAGRITSVEYHKGKFLVASKEQASMENEMNTITVEGGGSKVVFKQIAGLIARRIVCWKKAGDNVGLGERVGLIKFGSRADIWLGPEWTIAVRPGERVQGASSILARKEH